MENKALSIICGLAILAIVITGVSWQKGKSIENLQPENNSKLQNLFNSKVVQGYAINAHGTISNIKDGKITITSLQSEANSLSGGDSLEIPLSSDVKFFSGATVILTAGTESLLAPQENAISFKDIKVGDRVIIDIKIKSNGQFEGTVVRVILD